MKSIITVLLLLVAPLAFADESGWTDCIDTSIGRSGVVHHKSMCSDLVGDNPTTTMINFESCDNVDFIFISDTTAGNQTCSVQVMSCGSMTIDADNCRPLDGLTLTGASGDNEIQGGGIAYGYVKGTCTIGSDTPRVVAVCNP